MFVDYYSNICNSLRTVHLPFAAINGPLSLPAQRTKKVLEREKSYKELKPIACYTSTSRVPSGLFLFSNHVLIFHF